MKMEIIGGNLVLTLPLAEKPPVSKSGKTLVVASSRGNVRTNLEHQGQLITVGINAYITNPKAPAKTAA